MPTARACRTSRKCSSSRPAAEVSAPKTSAWVVAPGSLPQPHSAVCSSQVDPLGTSFCSLLPPPLLLCKCFPMHGECWALRSPWLPGRSALCTAVRFSGLRRCLLSSGPAALCCPVTLVRCSVPPSGPGSSASIPVLRLSPSSSASSVSSPFPPCAFSSLFAYLPFLRPCGRADSRCARLPSRSRSPPSPLSSLLSHASPPPRPRDSAQQTGGPASPWEETSNESSNCSPSAPAADRLGHVREVARCPSSLFPPCEVSSGLPQRAVVMVA